MQKKTKEVKLQSCAKINLSLSVGEKSSSNGLHEICSVFAPINLFDEISIKEADDFSVNFTGRFSEGISESDNSITKIFDILQDYQIQCKQKFKIVIKKNIPSMSGLGGGSSNAATILNFLARYFRINPENLRSIAFKAGSDVPFFLNPKVSIVRGFGERIEPIENPGVLGGDDLYIVLFFPDINCSTVDIYKKFDELGSFCNIKSVKIDKEDILRHCIEAGNDLESAVISHAPILKKYLASIRQYKPILSGITGSGSGFFAVFLNKNDAILCQKKANLGVESLICRVKN